MGNCDFKKQNNTVLMISKVNFAMHYVIGKGGYGKVWKVNFIKDKKNYAMKIMSKALIIAKKSVTSINYERELLSTITHPFICNMCYAFQDSEMLYLVMELSEGGDLRYHLFKNKTFNEVETKFLAACIIIALEYIHSHNIIHRDLKPENIIYDKNGYVKITDFGIARRWSPNNSNDTSGTPGYMAPEVVNSKQHGYAVDYWALGIILYELMMGKRPYAGINRKDYKERLLSTQVLVTECPQGWSEDAKDIVNKFLARKEEERLGSRDIKVIKSHPWFRDINWNELENLRVQAPYIPISINDEFDIKYLESFEMNSKVKEDIEMQSKNLRNPNTQIQFKEYYFDRDKSKSNRTAPTSGSK